MPNDFTVNKPASCPIAAGGMPRTDFAAVAHLSMFDFQGYYTTQSWNTFQGNPVTSFVQPIWSTGSQSDYFVNYSGYYYAGSGGCQSGTGYDQMWNDFRGADGGDIWARANLTYTCDFPALDLTTPYNAEVPPYTAYDVSVRINDIGMTGPVTYQWYVDDQLAGTTSTPTFTLTSGEAFSFQTVRAVASDGYGRSEVGENSFRSGSGCPNNEISC